MRLVQTFQRSSGLRPARRPPTSSRLQLNLPANKAAQAEIRRAIAVLPPLEGEAIRISSRRELSAHRGQLLSAHLERGTPVHAACFIRKREIVLESELFGSPATLRLILIHEIFHFVWTRLGNRARKQFADLILAECERGVEGELGESAGVKKELVVGRGAFRAKTRLWSEYVCESFCDTAAWLFSGIEEHSSFTLRKRWAQKRRTWFETALETPFRC